jgi:hypothetical protein
VIAIDLDVAIVVDHIDCTGNKRKTEETSNEKDKITLIEQNATEERGYKNETVLHPVLHAD